MSYCEALNSFNEELKVFGEIQLSKKYTEQELKKAFRLLSKKYHPDVNTKDNDDKMKKINVAYEVLKSNINQQEFYANKKDTESKSIDIEARREMYLNKIKEYNFDLSDNFKEQEQELVNLLSRISIKISIASTLAEMRLVFAEFESKRILIYTKIQKLFYKENYIESNCISENLNFRCNIKDFYKQLDYIRKKYAPFVKIEEKALTYETWQGYERLKIYIEYTVNVVKKRIENNTNTLEECLVTMDQVIQNLFNWYFETMSKITSLREKSTDQLFLNKLDQIEEDLKKDPIDFQKIKERLNALEEKINELENQKIKMNKIYARYIKEINMILQSFFPDKDAANFTYINECMYLISLIYKTVSNKKVDKRILEYLNNITFINLNIDLQPLRALVKELEVQSENEKEEIKPKFYVRKSGGIATNCIIMILEENQDTLKVAKWWGLEVEVLTMRKIELKKDFEPLDIYLNDENLVWKNQGDYKLLYTLGLFKTFAIYVDNNTRELGLTPFYVNYQHLPNIMDSTLNNFKNREYLKEKLSEQILKDIERTKNNKTRKRSC